MHSQLLWLPTPKNVFAIIKKIAEFGEITFFKQESGKDFDKPTFGYCEFVEREI